MPKMGFQKTKSVDGLSSIQFYFGFLQKKLRKTPLIVTISQRIRSILCLYTCYLCRSNDLNHCEWVHYDCSRVEMPCMLGVHDTETALK